mgnify:CR=1 FL=1
MKAVAAVNFGGLIDIPGNLLKAVAEQKHGKRNPHCGIGDHRRHWVFSTCIDLNIENRGIKIIWAEIICPAKMKR